MAERAGKLGAEVDIAGRDPPPHRGGLACSLTRASCTGNSHLDDIAGVLSVGVTLGVIAGVSPGPLMTLVITQTLRHGVREGLVVSVAPLLTDIPIILVSLLLLGQVAHAEMLFAALGVAGSLYLLYLAYETARAPPLACSVSDKAPESLKRAALVNALNPHPYLFWGTVGGPLVVRAAEAHPAAPWAFVAGFYVCLVGAKAGLAWLVSRRRAALTGRLYPHVLRALALALVAFAALLLRDAFRLFGLG